MTEALDLYRHERHTRMHAAVTQALRDLEQAGEPINISRVAAAAGVSRQWLYDSPFRAEIETLRERRKPAGCTTTRPTREAASEASLRSQIDALRQRLQTVRAERDALRHDLECALGLLRERSHNSSVVEPGHAHPEHGAGT